MSNIVEHTLNELSVRHTTYFVTKIYENDPGRDNMLGLSRMFGLFGIDSYGYALDAPSFLTNQIMPVIAATTKGFMLIKCIDNISVTGVYRDRNVTLDLNDFNKIWTGNVLVFDVKENACEIDIDEHIRRQREELFKKLCFFSATTIGIIYCLCHMGKTFGLGEWLFFATNVLTMTLCWLLLERQVKGRSNMGDKMCTAFKKKGCSSILESDAARPLLKLSWAEIGFGYCVSSTILLLFVPYSIFIIVLVSLTAIPISIWSLIYQCVKRRWCVLCVMVQFLIIIQAIIAIHDGMIAVYSINAGHIFNIMLYPTMILSVHYAARIFKEKINNQEQLHKIKTMVTESSVFSFLLQKQRLYNISEQDSTIIIGHPDAPNTITVFTNPYCEPCSKVHILLSSLLKQTEAYKVQYIFTTFDPEHDNSAIFLISYYIGHKESFTELLNEWFIKGKDNPAEFIIQHGGIVHDECARREYAHHKIWAAENNLKATPTILLNGYALPKEYAISDLAYVDCV